MQTDENGLSNRSETVGVLPIEKPHNEKPVGVYSVYLLRQALDVADDLGIHQVHLWKVPPADGSDGHMLVFTSDRDDTSGICVADLAEVDW